jgi:two-component system, OmpR family, response regulator
VRLLVVEDEDLLARALQRGLQAEGFAVDLAGDGVAGLEAARFGDYDAVVLDVMLPGLSGYRVVRALREDRNWVPVLMLSAKDGEYDLADGLDAGADDYLTKPFSFVVLLARLRALLRRGLGERPTVLAAVLPDGRRLTLDPAAHEVRLDDRTLDLTARELALLEYLLRHPGRVVPKAELLDHVWDHPVQSDLNLVEVYVGYLRRKLGREAVQTVRGAGYRLGPSPDDR